MALVVSIVFHQYSSVLSSSSTSLLPPCLTSTAMRTSSTSPTLSSTLSRGTKLRGRSPLFQFLQRLYFWRYRRPVGVIQEGRVRDNCQVGVPLYSLLMVVLIDSQVAFPDCSVLTKPNLSLLSLLVTKATTIILQMRNEWPRTNGCLSTGTTRVERRPIGTTRPALIHPAPISVLRQYPSCANIHSRMETSKYQHNCQNRPRQQAY